MNETLCVAIEGYNWEESGEGQIANIITNNPKRRQQAQHYQPRRQRRMETPSLTVGNNVLSPGAHIPSADYTANKSLDFTIRASVT
jgi:hypothetical protein